MLTSASALHANRLGSVGTFGREDLGISDEQLRKAVFSSLLCAIPVGFSQSEGQSNVLEYLCSVPGFLGCVWQLPGRSRGTAFTAFWACFD